MATTFTHHRTDRLDLRAVADTDLDALFALHGDPDGWHHFPAGRHTDIATTRAFLDLVLGGWAADGLSYWAVRRPGDETLIGLGGVRRLPDRSWNLAYRFATAARGHGYAQEVARAGIAAAGAVDPSVPVIAWIDDTNAASIRVAERVGLDFQGRRPSSDGTPLLAYADRALPPAED
ncbi:GNAT family acetyltransferase [Actinocatenispora thailandica]|uniref:GNAT family acetyltransferase n=1 Tax=Actinocatenispora thailandica TaxID=227318 RepID=A0A7R7DQI9_9ACTN|nr:GNAT family N-acetyltransferase [Actinocatenispora thailandica]BCJ35876.1 GNAT family acetyltransferase [Actinocatenispora thailandica]